MRDFPDGPGVKYPPSNEGDAGSVSCWGPKIPHAMGQLSLSTSTREAQTQQLKVPRGQLKTQHSQISEYIYTDEIHTLVKYSLFILPTCSYLSSLSSFIH